MINYDLMSRAVDSSEKFAYIKSERLKLKKEKNPLQESLKLVLNENGSSIKNSFNPTRGVQLTLV